MKPYYSDDSVTLYHGDALEVLAELDDASVDAVCTDPPYGIRFMGQAWDGADIVRGMETRRSQAPIPEDGKAGANGGYQSAAVEAGRYDLSPSANQAFQQWCEAWAAQCLRVLKPGGHLVSFGGARTWHRLTAGIEDAGFEIRDSIAWLYGSGFPKSLDVSKAIDKRAEENVETKRRIALVAEVIRTHREAKGMERAAVSLAVVGTPSGACWNWEHQQLPSVEMWPAIKHILDIPDTFDGLIQGDRAQFIAAEREVIGERKTGIGTGRGAVAYIADGENCDITAPATPDAQRWQGWGTALKPAFEPIVVARKPLAGTVAANVLEHGSGALNIDGSRIGDDTSRADRYNGKPAFSESEGYRLHNRDHPWVAPAGRWPANVVLDEDQAAALDEQSGNLSSGSGDRGTTSRDGLMGPDSDRGRVKRYQRDGDSGGASRFFYTAKADAAERIRVNGVAHPTVKPLDLMRWLVRLVTPPGGVVLDPFAGSGTTVEACILERFRCIAVEREADYLPLITQRINRRRDPAAYFAASDDDPGLFGVAAAEPGGAQ